MQVFKGLRALSAMSATLSSRSVAELSRTCMHRMHVCMHRLCMANQFQSQGMPTCSHAMLIVSAWQEHVPRPSAKPHHLVSNGLIVTACLLGSFSQLNSHCGTELAAVGSWTQPGVCAMWHKYCVVCMCWSVYAQAKV